MGVGGIVRVGRALVVIVGVAVITSAGGDALAADGSPITVDEKTVAIADGVAKVTVRNTTGVDVDVSAGLQLDTTSTLELLDPVPVTAGAATTISLDASGVVATASTRVVVVVAATIEFPDGWSTSVPVKVAAPAAAKPAVASAEVTSRDFGDTRHIKVPLENTGTCADVLLPSDTTATTAPAPPAPSTTASATPASSTIAAVDSAATGTGSTDAAPSTTDATTTTVATTGVGFVTAGDHISTVTATCIERAADDQPLYADVVVQGLAWDGLDYAGTIDLAPDDDEAGDLEVKVRRTMPFRLFFGLLALGLGLAYVAHLWTGGVRTAVAERLRGRRLAEQIKSTKPDAPLIQFATTCALGGIADNVRDWNIAGGLSGELDTVDAELSRHVRWFRLPSATAVKEAGEKIGKIDTATKALPELANTLVRLGAVRRKLDALASFQETTLAATLNRPRDGAPTGSAALTAIDEAARNAIRIATNWPADLITATRADMAWLERVLPGNTPLAPAFLEARREATAAWATFTDQANGAHTDEQIDAAMLQLYETRGQIAAARNAFADLETVVVGVLPVGTPETRRPAVAPQDQATVRPPTPSWWLRTRMWLTDGVVFALVVVAALAAGIQALYVDKTIGGVWGCVTVVLWAFVSGTVAKPIAAAVERFADPSPKPAGQD
jgi:hypothetical protein